MKHVPTLLLLLVCLLSVGCTRGITVGKNDPPEPRLEFPQSRLPEEMRFRNWVVNGEGSCAVASSTYILSYLGHHEKSKWLRRNRGGGQTETSLRKIFDEIQLNYEYTSKGNPQFLERMSADRRPCTIWWKPYHSCVFVSAENVEGYGKCAIVWDNNSPSKYEVYEWNKFVRAWRGYGGFAITFTDERATPAAPLAWDFFRFIHEGG